MVNGQLREADQKINIILNNLYEYNLAQLLPLHLRAEVMPPAPRSEFGAGSKGEL
jgi:small nuclear ribonucleoprotein (snRNP)-like protein